MNKIKLSVATRSLLVSALAAPVMFLSLDAAALEPIEELGKHVFFDQKMSVPGNKQSCASCHDPKVGWILPNSDINRTTVVAPGARPGALGSIKAPANAYANFSPVFKSIPPGPIPPWEGGNFWDGRAEGCGAESAYQPVDEVGWF